MTRELKGWVRPRPLRIAFLIQEGEHADLMLDGIFADCYGRWGGRFSLVVPCVDGRILPNYWPWLEAYDPDIVYSYVALSRADILEIHERVCPAQYGFHSVDQERLNVFGFKPQYDEAPLSSLSTIFRLSRYSPAVGARAGVSLIDSWHTERASRFLTDNFGTYRTSHGGAFFPPDAMPAANLLTIVSPEAQANRQLGVPRDLNVIPNELAAFAAFADRTATSLSMASLLFAPKLDIRHGRWSASFNLVVGDSFHDRIMFWNARLLIPGWLDTDICCLRVGLDQLEDENFLAVVGELLKRRNHINAGSGGQYHVTIRSTSLGQQELNRALELVNSTRPWSFVTVEKVPGAEALVPPQEALDAAREGNRFGEGILPRPDWDRFNWSSPAARPPSVVPDHLSDAPPRQSFTTGYWANDFILEYEGPRIRWTEQNRWALPRRWRIAEAFKVELANGPQHAMSPAIRRSRDGNLTVILKADHPIESITVPTPYEAIQRAFASGRNWEVGEVPPARIRPLAKVVWTAPSNEARYFAGVLGMAGGLRRASDFLLHPFLKQLFARLGGTPDLPIEKVSPTVNRLRKKVPRTVPFDLSSEEERTYLGALIVKAAQTLKTPSAFARFESLKERWRDYRATFWEAHAQNRNPDADVDWDRYEERSLDSCLIELRRQQILFQGHQWTCPVCHHRNWVDLASLAPELACEVCKTKSNAPIEIDWLFRPNEFLIESLRDHSVLSLVWTLTELGRRARNSFIYVEPTWFGYTDDGATPDAEADLLVLVDGKAVLCEVKSSWHSLRVADIPSFVALARRLRPDVALLAVMEPGPGPRDALAAAGNELAADGIQFEVMTFDPARAEDHPYLPGADE